MDFSENHQNVRRLLQIRRSASFHLGRSAWSSRGSNMKRFGAIWRGFGSYNRLLLRNQELKILLPGQSICSVFQKPRRADISEMRAPPHEVIGFFVSLGHVLEVLGVSGPNPRFPFAQSIQPLHESAYPR